MAGDGSFDIFSSDNSDDSSSGLTDVLTSLTEAAGSAYVSYNQAQSGIVPLGNGNYAVQPGSQAHIVAGPQQSNNTLLFVGALALFGLFAFTKMK